MNFLLLVEKRHSQWEHNKRSFHPIRFRCHSFYSIDQSVGNKSHTMVFYATSSGVIFEPLSKEAKRMDHDAGQARNRLRQKLEERREQQQAEAEEFWAQEEHDAAGEYNGEDVSDNNKDNACRDLEVLEIEQRLREQRVTLENIDKQNNYNKFLAQQHRMNKRGIESKAIPSQYHYKPDEADNAAKRAIVHHTGSHYHMAGSRQFQRGVRVKGVVSRHSKQGAKLQAARSAKRNAMTAREDARGIRTEGGSGGKGSSSSGNAGGGKKKKKNKNVNK